VSDLLCRESGIGFGFPEDRQTKILEEPGFALLRTQFPALLPFDWARFTFEMEGVIEEAYSTVNQVYGAMQ